VIASRPLTAASAVALLLAGCTMKPADPFVVAERARARHDLAQALQAYDGVAVEHPRYPEARAAALAVESDMRRSHELLLEALLLRAEWRDREALTVLRRVRELWPESAGVKVLISATEQRLRLMGNVIGTTPALPPAPRAIRELVHDPKAEPHVELGTQAAMPAGEASAPAAGGPPAGNQEQGPVSGSQSGSAATTSAATTSSGTMGASSAPSSSVQGIDPVASGLVAVETSLCRGQLEAAVAALLELARRFPDDARVTIRLVRLLHQRALLRYGEGALAAAITDWRRVLELAPDHAAARQMLAIAEREGRAH
jgi:tetratricopeptide (TPR) repeat protein